MVSTCWSPGHVGGAIRLVTQRPGHVARHAPNGCLRWGSGFGQVWTNGCGLERSTCLKRGDGPSQSSRVRHPSFGRPSCRLPTAASSPVTEEVAGRSADPAPGAGSLIADSVEWPELASSVALRLPTSWLDGRWEALAAPSYVVLRLPAGTTGFLFLLDRAILSCLRSAGES